MFILSSRQCSKSCVCFSMHVHSEDDSETAVLLSKLMGKD